MNQLKKITELHLGHILKDFKSIRSDVIFDIINEVIENFNCTNELVNDIFTATCSLILSKIGFVRITLKKNSSNTKKNNDTFNKLIKCFNIVRSICEKSNYVANNFVSNFK